jgi:ferredoxin--NADP+ reductase/dihydroorotate dehydrogenase electron transfer subunit
MMKVGAGVASPYDVEILVSLNSIMVDGTGMCGGCRVTIDGKTKFTCVDGPEFNARKVDFVELIDRLATYRGEETKAAEKYEEECRCGLH